MQIIYYFFKLSFDYCLFCRGYTHIFFFSKSQYSFTVKKGENVINITITDIDRTMITAILTKQKRASRIALYAGKTVNF